MSAESTCSSAEAETRRRLGRVGGDSSRGTALATLGSSRCRGAGPSGVGPRGVRAPELTTRGEEHGAFSVHPAPAAALHRCGGGGHSDRGRRRCQHLAGRASVRAPGQAPSVSRSAATWPWASTSCSAGAVSPRGRRRTSSWGGGPCQSVVMRHSGLVLRIPRRRSGPAQYQAESSSPTTSIGPDSGAPRSICSITSVGGSIISVASSR